MELICCEIRIVVGNHTTLGFSQNSLDSISYLELFRENSNRSTTVLNLICRCYFNYKSTKVKTKFKMFLVQCKVLANEVQVSNLYHWLKSMLIVFPNSSALGSRLKSLCALQFWTQCLSAWLDLKLKNLSYCYLLFSCCN